MHAKHEKEEIHVEEFEQQVVQVIEQAEQQEIMIEVDQKAVNASFANIDPE